MDERYARILVGLGSAIIVLLIAVIVVVLTGRDDDQQAVGTTEPPTAGGETTTSLETTTTSTLGETSTTAAGTTTATAVATTTSAPPTTSTSTTTTTTTLPAGPCPGTPPAEMPPGATDVSQAFGDFDGDGVGDTFRVFRDPGGQWWARMEFPNGYATQVPSITGMIAEAWGTTDIGHTGDVAFGVVDVGASDERIGFFYFDSCGVWPVYESGGELAQFPVGGSVTHVEGLTCRPDGVDVTQAAETANPGEWSVSSVSYLWNPGTFELEAQLGAAALLHSPADDAAIYAHGDFNC